MSTGADCKIYDKSKGEWYYDLQRWPYGDNPDYDTEGPFPHYLAATEHLHKHHANPGGHSVKALPGCPHDMTEPIEFPQSPWDDDQVYCNRCGGHVSTLDRETWESRVMAYLGKERYPTVALIKTRLGDDLAKMLDEAYADRKPPAGAGLDIQNVALNRK